MLARIRRPVPLYWATFLFMGVSLGATGPALTDLRDRTGSDIGAIGILFVGQSAGYIVGSFAGGQLYDRFRGHRVYAGSLALVSAGLVAVPVLSSLLGLFAAFLLVGVGSAVCGVGANTLLMWELGNQSSRAMNVMHLCFGIGALSAPLFVDVGLALAMWLAAGACLALAAASLVIPAPVVRPSTGEQSTEQPRLLLALLASFFFVYVGLELGFAGWIHTYAEEIELGDTAATWLTTTFWIGFTVGRAGSAALAPYVRPKYVMAGACCGTIAASAALTIGNGATAVIWASTALFGLSAAPQFPTMMAYLERRIRVTGQATSWFIGASGFGGLIFPWLVGQWFAATGPTALPWATTILAVVTGAAFIVSNRALGG